MIAEGCGVRLFEQQVASFLGARHATAQSSGTAALILALRALGIGAGDQVVIPTYVCRNVLDAVVSVGAEAALCDVNQSGLITRETVSPHITPSTKAIIAVHIFGHVCDIASLKSFGIPVVDDACQAFGATVQGQMAGASSDVGVVSFHATKCLTSGEGGMLITDNDIIAGHAHALCRSGGGHSPRLVAPMSDLQAALGLEQLKRYESFISRRREIASLYDQTIDSISAASIGHRDQGYKFRYTVRVQARHRDFDEIQREFSSVGIQVRRGVDALLHRGRHLPDAEYPGASRLFEHNVSIPFYPALTENEVSRICDAMKRFLA